VASSGDGLHNEIQRSAVNPRAWSTTSFVSRGEAERRLECSRRQELRVMITGIDSMRNRTSKGHQPVRKGERSRGVPKSGCRVTSFCQNRRNMAAAEADSDELIHWPGDDFERGNG
jgi:hypothetical protein